MPDRDPGSAPPEHTDPDEALSGEAPPPGSTPLPSTLVTPGEGAGEPGPDEGSEADEEWVSRSTRGIRLALPVAALLALVLLGAGFWGGAALEKSHNGGSSGAGAAAGFAARFRSGRSGAATGTSGASGFSFPGGGFGSSSAASGTISVVDGDTIYVLTAAGALVKVTLTSSTTVTRNSTAKPVALRPGDAVVVQGTTSAAGNVAASSIAATAPGASSGTAGLLGGAGGAATTTTGG
jgi:hypothetical protein